MAHVQIKSTVPSGRVTLYLLWRIFFFLPIMPGSFKSFLCVIGILKAKELCSCKSVQWNLTGVETAVLIQLLEDKAKMKID